LVAGQLSLFGHDTLGFDPRFERAERIVLGHGAWLELVRGWASGHARLFELLARSVDWQEESRTMYERAVTVPRLLGAVRRGDPAFDVVDRMRTSIGIRYGEVFDRIGLALYRDGRDSVAWHGDYVARRMEVATVATVSLGSPRRFLVRTNDGGEPARALSLGFGDLLVMGGSCQRTHEHAIPKAAVASPRIALMFRPTWPEPTP